MCIGGSGEALAVNLPTTSGTYHFHRTDTIHLGLALQKKDRDLISKTNGLREARGMASIVSFHSLASQQGMTSPLVQLPSNLLDNMASGP